MHAAVANDPPVCPASSPEASACFHCGERNPAGARWHHVVDGRDRAFCCAGCAAIARTIDAAGLAPYYEQRTSQGPRAQADDVERSRHVAQAIAAGLITETASGDCEASLLLEGMHCGACAWLVETWLARKPGVVE